MTIFKAPCEIAVIGWLIAEQPCSASFQTAKDAAFSLFLPIGKRSSSSSFPQISKDPDDEALSLSEATEIFQILVVFEFHFQFRLAFEHLLYAVSS